MCDGRKRGGMREREVLYNQEKTFTEGFIFGIQDKDEELHHSTLGSCITHEHNLRVLTGRGGV